MAPASYHVMRWHSAMDGPWSAEASRRFQQQEFDGLVIVPSAEWKPRDLAFLADLDGLRSFSFTGRLRNDVDAFQVATLEDLTLVTGSKVTVPDDAQQVHLTRLCLTDRPGLAVDQHWPRLEWLRVGTWKATDLRFLEGASNLRHVHLEGRRQQGELEGVQGCTKIESLTMINYSIMDTAPLRGLDALAEVKLMAAKPTASHGRLDLADIASPSLSKLWISNASELRNLESLRDRPVLREVRLIGCPLSDADSQALSSLPRRVNVQLVS
jgi:hypothetical protein